MYSLVVQAAAQKIAKPATQPKVVARHQLMLVIVSARNMSSGRSEVIDLRVHHEQKRVDEPRHHSECELLSPGGIIQPKIRPTGGRTRPSLDASQPRRAPDTATMGTTLL